MAGEIRSFFVEATQELLYNIVNDKRDEEGEIGYRELSEEFEEKVGYRPMDFFGLGNFTGKGWFDFLRCSPGLSLDGRYVSQQWCDGVVYDNYNSENMFLVSENYLPTTLADYREMLLIHACELIVEDGLIDVKHRVDVYGNTPLHLVAAMPGVTDHEPSLLKCLLRAGADPLQENNNGLNILHIIAGRIKAEEDESGDQYFGTERIDASSWEFGHRLGLLNLLFEELSSTHLAVLTNRPGPDDNTVMHEWVLSTSAANLIKASPVYEKESTLLAKDIEIASKLLSFGGNLKIPNKLGNVPLHFACNSFVFKFLLQEGAVCRSRNAHDETPFLFILKYFVAQVFVYTSGVEEIREFLDISKKETDTSSFDKVCKKTAVVLEHLIQLIEESKEVKKTIWIPDIEDVSPLEILLVCIRIAYYRLPFKLSHLYLIYRQLIILRKKLLKLLNVILRTGNPSHLRRQNKKGQGPLHILLDMNSNKVNQSSVEDVLQLLEALIQNGADVNAVDTKGQTPLDVTCKFMESIPSFRDKCVEILLKNGAKMFAEDRFGKTTEPFSTSPFVYAKRKLRSCPQRHSNIANQLTKHRKDVTVVQKYRYFNQTPIGSGAFSSIYVAIKEEHLDEKSATIDCRAIALKRIEKAKVNRQEIKREVQALLSISRGCENILNCYESIEDDFFHYLSLDLMDGDLRQFIDNSSAKALMQQSTETPIQAAQDIINGLTYLHENDFIHRDLKPGNILYTVQPSLHFKIGDFGLAKNISSSCTVTSTRGGGVAMAPGTRCWMAPELVSLQSREHKKESDVFALGLVLHYLLTLGKHPFVGDKEEPPHVIEKNIVDMKISIDQSLSIEASSFIQVILAKVPSKRPPIKFLDQHPFLWKEKKKIEFLKAVGDQPEAANPSIYPNSNLERCLQKTGVGYRSWDKRLPELFSEMTNAWKQKKYRTNHVIDLVRFLRNAYSHKEERSLSTKLKLDSNIFFKKFPSLVLDVFGAVQNAGLLDDENRSNIRQAVSTS